MTRTSEARARARSLAGLLATVLVVASCANGGDPTGGETHFLRWCSPESAPCEDGLSCVCGVCSLTCTESGACAGLQAVECVATTELDVCDGTVPAGRCDVTCARDADCAAVSPSHRCLAGACRTGEPASPCPSSNVTGNDVLLLGDSFFGATHQITAYLEELARAAGALATGERYRDNSTPIDNALAFGGNRIQAQYERGASEAPVRVVIMNGGGGDLFPSRCTEPLSSCDDITNAVAAAEQLFAQMAEARVEHVLYVSYPDPTDADLRARLDAFRPLMQGACESSAAPCQWLDLRTAFAGHPDYLAPDGMNPSESGARAAAGVIWSTLRNACIAQ